MTAVFVSRASPCAGSPGSPVTSTVAPAAAASSSREPALPEQTATTLVAQAETAHASLLGAYQTGDASAMDAIRGQSELLELQRGLVEARAQHAVAWARLEQTVGRPVERAPEVEPQ